MRIARLAWLANPNRTIDPVAAAYEFYGWLMAFYGWLAGLTEQASAGYG